MRLAVGRRRTPLLLQHIFKSIKLLLLLFTINLSPSSKPRTFSLTNTIVIVNLSRAWSRVPHGRRWLNELMNELNVEHERHTKRLNRWSAFEPVLSNSWVTQPNFDWGLYFRLYAYLTSSFISQISDTMVKWTTDNHRRNHCNILKILFSISSWCLSIIIITFHVP